MIRVGNVHMATAEQQPYSLGRAPGIMSNCFNRDGWFGIVGAGRDLSLLSLLKPELPGDEQCWCRECRAVIWSVHIVIIYLGPSVTRLVVQRSKKKGGGGANKEENARESAGEVVQISL